MALDEGDLMTGYRLRSAVGCGPDAESPLGLDDVCYRLRTANLAVILKCSTSGVGDSVLLQSDLEEAHTRMLHYFYVNSSDTAHRDSVIRAS